PEAITILFGTAYASPEVVLITGIAGLCMLGEAIKLYHLDIAFMLKEETKAQIAITGKAFVANLIGCLIVIPIFGPTAAAIIALLTVILLALLSYRSGRSLFRIPMPVQPLGGILLCCLAMTGGVLAVDMESDAMGLTLKVLTGVALYGVTAWLLNAGGCRTFLQDFSDARSVSP
nr:polysaccharide biosynthesis C-terminal domain-containing protein [Rhodospirillaceae bacterium]